MYFCVQPAPHHHCLASDRHPDGNSSLDNPSRTSLRKKGIKKRQEKPTKTSKQKSPKTMWQLDVKKNKQANKTKALFFFFTRIQCKCKNISGYMSLKSCLSTHDCNGSRLCFGQDKQIYLSLGDCDLFLLKLVKWIPFYLIVCSQ